jgi:hypothetical protein
MSDNILGKIEVLKLFKSQLLAFLESLTEMFPEEHDLLSMRVIFDIEIPVEEAMRIFCKKILPVKDMIKNRNDKFFTEEFNFTIDDTKGSKAVNTEKVTKWKNIWKSNRLSKDDRISIWKWFDIFLVLSEIYNRHDPVSIS